MAGRYWLAVLVAMVLFLSDGQCEPNCKGADGHAGQAGIPGRDGKPGAKGEKGEPGKSFSDLLPPRGQSHKLEFNQKSSKSEEPRTSCRGRPDEAEGKHWKSGPARGHGS